MLAELALQEQLLLGTLEGLADCTATVDAGDVEEPHELVAGLVKDLVLITHADYVAGSCLQEHPPCRFRVATRHQDKLRCSLASQQLSKSSTSHTLRLSSFSLK